MKLEEIAIRQKEIILAKDILSYLKLRIITAALNEGWEPTFEYGKSKYELRFRYDGGYAIRNDTTCYGQASKLFLKSPGLAEYAATQFKSIYTEFCCKRRE